MRPFLRILRFLGPSSIAVSAVLLVATLAPPTWAAIHASIQPPAGAVTPGTDFDVNIVVTESGSAFNAIDLIVTYDPAVLTLVPRSPLSLQEGALMTAACGTRFHRFKQGADRDTITDILLCAGVSVAGPGQVYRLRFHASSVPQVTWIRFHAASRFYNAGISVAPLALSDGAVGIGLTLDAERPTPARLELRGSPSPFRSHARLTMAVPSAGHYDLRVMDVSGRVVRRLFAGTLPAGEHTFVWDGRAGDGAVARAGRYFVLATGPDAIARRTLVRLD